MQGSVLPEEFENPGTIPHSRFPDPPFATYDKLPCLSPVPSSLAQHLKGPARFQETPGTPTERWEGQPYLLGDSLRLSTNSLR
jgi:hypothetical protein